MVHSLFVNMRDVAHLIADSGAESMGLSNLSLPCRGLVWSGRSLAVGPRWCVLDNGRRTRAEE